MNGEDMKAIFILNPKAGKGTGLAKLKADIEKAAKELCLDTGIYYTKAVGDAEAFVKLACKEAEENGEEVRLFACGGDGTVNEVLNGMIGFECASLGIVPIGTGNDFVRNFPEAGDFKDIRAQLEGNTEKCDVIRYSGILSGESKTRYCINMFNIGFDCNVVDLTAKLKEYPLIKGSFAYLAAVAGILIKKKGANLRVKVDGEVLSEGPILLTSVANGGYCGGGVNSSPVASTKDGLMDVNIIYNISRTNFVKKFPYYSKGTHMNLPDIDDFLCFRQCKEVEITPLDGTMRLCTDGEIEDAGQVTMQIVPEAVNVVIPKA